MTTHLFNTLSSKDDGDILIFVIWMCPFLAERALNSSVQCNLNQIWYFFTLYLEVTWNYAYDYLLYKDTGFEKKILENMTGGYYGLCVNEFHHIKSLKVVSYTIK